MQHHTTDYLRMTTKFNTTGSVDCKCPFDEDLLNDAKEEYGYTGHLFVNEDYKVYADSVCTDYALNYPPSTHEDALYMFFVLKDDSDSLIIT